MPTPSQFLVHHRPLIERIELLLRRHEPEILLQLPDAQHSVAARAQDHDAAAASAQHQQRRHDCNRGNAARRQTLNRLCRLREAQFVREHTVDHIGEGSRVDAAPAFTLWREYRAVRRPWRPRRYLWVWRRMRRREGWRDVGWRRRSRFKVCIRWSPIPPGIVSWIGWWRGVGRPLRR